MHFLNFLEQETLKVNGFTILYSITLLFESSHNIKNGKKTKQEWKEVEVFFSNSNSKFFDFFAERNIKPKNLPKVFTFFISKLTAFAL